MPNLHTIYLMYELCLTQDIYWTCSTSMQLHLSIPQSSTNSITRNLSPQQVQSQSKSSTDATRSIRLISSTFNFDCVLRKSNQFELQFELEQQHTLPPHVDSLIALAKLTECAECNEVVNGLTPLLDIDTQYQFQAPSPSPFPSRRVFFFWPMWNRKTRSESNERAKPDGIQPMVGLCKLSLLTMNVYYCIRLTGSNNNKNKAKWQKELPIGSSDWAGNKILP